MKNLLHNPLWKPSLVSLHHPGLFYRDCHRFFSIGIIGLNMKIYKEYLGNKAYKVTEYHQY